MTLRDTGSVTGFDSAASPTQPAGRTPALLPGAAAGQPKWQVVKGGVALALALLVVAASVLAVDRERAAARQDVANAAALGDLIIHLTVLDSQINTALATPDQWRAFTAAHPTASSAPDAVTKLASLSSEPVIAARVHAVDAAFARVDAAARGSGDNWAQATAALSFAQVRLTDRVADQQSERLKTAKQTLARADSLARLTHAGTMLLLIAFAGALLLRERRVQQQRLGVIAAGQQLLQEVLDHSPTAIYLRDRAGRYTLVNRAWEAATGRSRDSTLGRNAAELWPAGVEEPSRTAEIALAADESSGRLVPGPSGDGRVFLERQFALRDPAGEAYAIGGVATDVTEQLAAREREQLLAAVVNSASDAIFTVRNGRIATFNPAARKLFGAQLEQPDRRLADLAATDSRVDIDQLLAAAAHEPMTDQETILVGSDGAPLHMSLTLTRLDGDSSVISVVARDVGAARRHQAELTRQARHDSLTGLLNRLGLQQHLPSAATGSTDTRPGALMFLDLDQFKLVNDSFGHGTGDAVLQRVAARLAKGCEPDDIVARLGGDEFAILSPQATDAAGALDKAERLRRAVSEPVDVDGAGRLSVTATIGVAMGPADDPGTWMREADIAMYAGKHTGRDRAVLYTDEQGLEAVSQQQLRSDLRTATADGQLTLVYQPVVDLQTGHAAGVEALCRWTHPQRGPVPPDLFIPLAEDSGVIGEIGTYVWQESVRQLLEWDVSGPAGLHLAVNVSVRQLADAAFLQLVSDTMQRFPQLRGRLMVELTESVLLQEALLPDLIALQERGARLAIDDFGTGYSALSYLSRFPVDTIKIDKSFIEGAALSRDAHAVLRTVLQLAGALKLSTIAEGVEDAGTATLLMEAGCTQGQGFYWSRPVPAPELPEALASLSPTPVEPTSQPKARRRVVDDPAVTARVIQLRAAGASFHTIAAILNKEEIIAPHGRRWHASAVAKLLARQQPSHATANALS